MSSFDREEASTRRGGTRRDADRALHRWTMRRLLPLLAIAFVVGSLVHGSVAWGHARLERSEPASGAVLAAPPAQVVLHFDGEVERRFSRFTLRLPDGSERKLAAPSGGGLARALTISLGPPAALAPGAYALAWSVVSRDGHRIEGTLRFTVRGG